METVAVIQLATPHPFEGAGSLSRGLAALLTGRINRAQNVQASLVELRMSPWDAEEEALGARPVLPPENIHSEDGGDKFAAAHRFSNLELDSIARTFNARTWLTGSLRVDEDAQLFALELEMAKAGTRGPLEGAAWECSFEGELDEVAAVLNAAALAVVEELGEDAEAIVPKLPIETRSFEAFSHYCAALDTDEADIAFEELEDACGVDPYFVEAHGERALWALRSADEARFNESATQLLHVGHMRPNRLAEELTRLSDLGFADETMGYALLAARLVPSHGALMALVGRLGLQIGSGAAMEAIELLDEQRGEDYQLLALSASLHYLIEDEPAANALAERAIAQAANEPGARARCLYDLGAHALQSESFELAASYLERALADNPALDHARGDLAAAYMRLTRFDEAAELLHDADSSQVILQSNLALALRQLGRLPEAVDAARRAVDADPRHPQAWAILGDLFRLGGDMEASCEAFEQATRAQPDNVVWHLELGRVLFHLGRSQEAVERFKVVMAHQPELAQITPELLFVLAEFAQRDDRQADAESLLRTALDVEPSFWQAANNLGIMMLQRERIEEAVAFLSTALEVAADHEGVRFNLEKALARLPHLH